MLSFMREQGAGNPSANQTKNGGQQPSNGSEDNGSLEYLTVATTSKSLRKSTILVAILVSIGLICLWFMIRKSQPQAASAKQSDEEQTKMEAAIGRLTGISSEMVSKMDEILKKFYEFSGVLQVQVGDLVKNPFEVEGFAKDIKGEVTPQGDPAAQAALVKRERLKQRAGSLSLLSVMQSGPSSSCMINDKILRQGDTIEGFVITRIGGDSVDLAWRGDGDPAGKTSAATEEFNIVLKLSQ
jgi:preprotein translocase subunit SecG